MHSDESLKALGYRFGSGTENLADHHSINSHLSRGGPLRFADLSRRRSRDSTLVFAGVVRCVVHMHAIDVIGKRHINTSKAE